MNTADTYTDEEIVAYLAGDLQPDQAQAIAAWIETSAEARQRVAEFRLLEEVFTGAMSQPAPPGLFSAFHDALRQESAPGRSGYAWMGIAAAALLTVGGFILGHLTGSNHQTTNELAALQGEVRTLQQLVMLNTLQDHSASDRLQAIHVMEESSSVDHEFIQALIRTMNNDTSPNVRYAAVQALGGFTDSEAVRVQFVRALRAQEDPLVQIAIISLLGESGEPAAIDPIRRLAEAEDTPMEVRHTAEIALSLLMSASSTNTDKRTKI